MFQQTIKEQDKLTIISAIRKRIALEEMLAHTLNLKFIKRVLHAKKAICLNINESKHLKLIQSLPFELTQSQSKVCNEIFNDLATNTPMSRLVQGDVGSGKTIVALAAILQALENGYQVAFLVPTEILAEQHFQTLEPILGKFNFKTSLLLGNVSTKNKSEILDDLYKHKINLLIGTHAMLEPSVKFKYLALVVIDEQHRFGVKQRMQLCKPQSGAFIPHQLCMTATPIPRTLAMTMYADQQISTIDQMPKGRKNITTVVLCERNRPNLLARVSSVCERGEQAYWVCPIIETNSNEHLISADVLFKHLSQSLPGLSLGLLHGRLKPAEKKELIDQFKAKKIQVLVATTVIEVGINIPSCNIMIIENAERFGLSQLHQLRGRVGRGQEQSYCVLLYSKAITFEGRKRLLQLKKYSCGFKIAEKDLHFRGSGEILGEKQAGQLHFKVANLENDIHLLEQVNQIAQEMIATFPQQAKLLIKLWFGEKIAFTGFLVPSNCCFKIN